MFALSSPVSNNSTPEPSSSAPAAGTPSRLATAPPVPAFNAPEPRESPNDRARDDSPPAVMQDVGGKKQHHHQRRHHHQPGRQQQSRSPNHPSSDLFRGGGARRRDVELRLQSPLSTPGRRRGGGGSGSGGSGSGSCGGSGGRWSGDVSSGGGGSVDGNSSNDNRDCRSFFSNRSANNATRGRRQTQYEADTDDRNADMAEAETGDGDDGAVDAASPLSQTAGGGGAEGGMWSDTGDHCDARGGTTNASTREVRVQYAPPFQTCCTPVCGDNVLGSRVGQLLLYSRKGFRNWNLTKIGASFCAKILGNLLCFG